MRLGLSIFALCATVVGTIFAVSAEPSHEKPLVETEETVIPFIAQASSPGGGIDADDLKAIFDAVVAHGYAKASPGCISTCARLLGGRLAFQYRLEPDTPKTVSGLIGLAEVYSPLVFGRIDMRTLPRPALDEQVSLRVLQHLFPVWVAQQRLWVQKRHQALTKWGGWVNIDRPLTAPGALWLFGERAPNFVTLFVRTDERFSVTSTEHSEERPYAVLTAADEAEVERVAQLFPEAHVWTDILGPGETIALPRGIRGIDERKVSRKSKLRSRSAAAH